MQSGRHKNAFKNSLEFESRTDVAVFDEVRERKRHLERDDGHDGNTEKRYRCEPHR